MGYMQAEIKFRPLIAADYSAVATLWRRCDGIEIAEGDDETSFRSYLERNPGLSHCADADGTLIGAALCGHDGRRGFIYHLAVASAFRGRGVGKEILNRGLAGLQERGIARALVLVAEDNTPGREFWLSQGFESISGALPLGTDLM
jgi:ribosomal protein S18 acetylase RimI-like enzyme